MISSNTASVLLIFSISGILAGQMKNYESSVVVKVVNKYLNPNTTSIKTDIWAAFLTMQCSNSLWRTIHGIIVLWYSEMLRRIFYAKVIFIKSFSLSNWTNFDFPLKNNFLLKSPHSFICSNIDQNYSWTRHLIKDHLST